MKPHVSDPLWSLHTLLYNQLSVENPEVWEKIADVVGPLSTHIIRARSNPVVTMEQYSYAGYNRDVETTDDVLKAFLFSMWQYIPYAGMYFYDENPKWRAWRSEYLASQDILPENDSSTNFRYIREAGLRLPDFAESVKHGQKYKFIAALADSPQSGDSCNQLLRRVVSVYQGPCFVLRTA